MTVLLSCSTNLLGSNLHNNSSTGEAVDEDSVLISYNDLRTVNAKLVELKYVKEQNEKLREVCVLDSTAIASLRAEVTRCKNKVKSKDKQLFGLLGVAIAELIVILVK